MNSTPNSIIADNNDWHISYNNVDQWHYGCDTTAVVANNLERFYILNGNHSKQLKNLDFNGCLTYLHENKDLLNKYSDLLPPD